MVMLEIKKKIKFLVMLAYLVFDGGVKKTSG